VGRQRDSTLKGWGKGKGSERGKTNRIERMARKVKGRGRIQTGKEGGEERQRFATLTDKLKSCL